MPKIMLIAGEASGDVHAAKVVMALKQNNPEIDCFGIGGEKMQAAGCRLIMNSKSIAVMGLFEVLKHFRAIRRAWNLAVYTLEQEKPECLILVDYPGFNLRFAAKAKALGIKVLYYVSPQIWAWKKGRIHKIKRLVDHMAVILPFEAKIYEAVGVPVTFVGSPLLEQVEYHEPSQARQQLKLPAGQCIVGLLPGSRDSEIARLFPVLLSAAKLLQQQYSEKIQFVVPLADNVAEADLMTYRNKAAVSFIFIKQHSHEVMAAADLLIGASGTATLEAAIVGTPMIVIYKMNSLTFALAKRLVKIPFISLPNILAKKQIYPELIQDRANPGEIVKVALQVLSHKTTVTEMKAALDVVVKQLGTAGAGQRVAEIALRLCHVK